jgi:hypothetical protein
VLRLEPDLFVVYAGNNEVVGPYGAGTVLTAAAPPLPLVRASVAARRARRGQLVGHVVRAAGKSLGRDEAPELLTRALEIAPESDAVRRDLEALRDGAPPGGR